MRHETTTLSQGLQNKSISFQMNGAMKPWDRSESELHQRRTKEVIPVLFNMNVAGRPSCTGQGSEVRGQAGTHRFTPHTLTSDGFLHHRDHCALIRGSPCLLTRGSPWLLEVSISWSSSVALLSSSWLPEPCWAGAGRPWWPGGATAVAHPSGWFHSFITSVTICVLKHKKKKKTYI